MSDDYRQDIRKPVPTSPRPEGNAAVTTAQSQTHPQSHPQKAASTKPKKRSWHLRVPGKKKSLILAVLALIVLVCAGFWAFNYFTMPAHITKAEFRRALSSRTTDAPVKDTYSVGEPIMFVFDYDNAKPNTSAVMTVKKGKDTIRTVELPALRSDDKSASKGQRFVSIVNGTATQLAAGTYTVTVSSGSRELASKNVTIQ